MAGWYHRLNRQEFEQALGDNEGQGSLAGYSPWGPKQSDMTEQLNRNDGHLIFDKGGKNIQCRKDNLFNKCWQKWSVTCKMGMISSAWPLLSAKMEAKVL